MQKPVAMSPIPLANRIIVSDVSHGRLGERRRECCATQKKATAISGRPGLSNNWMEKEVWCDTS